MDCAVSVSLSRAVVHGKGMCTLYRVECSRAGAVHRRRLDGCRKAYVTADRICRLGGVTQGYEPMTLANTDADIFAEIWDRRYMAAADAKEAILRSIGISWLQASMAARADSPRRGRLVTASVTAGPNEAPSHELCLKRKNCTVGIHIEATGSQLKMLLGNGERVVREIPPASSNTDVVA